MDKNVIRITEDELKQIVNEATNKILSENKFKSYFGKKRAAIAAQGKNQGKTKEQIWQDLLNADAKNQAINDINKERSVLNLPMYDRTFNTRVHDKTFDINFDDLDEPYYDNITYGQPIDTDVMASRNPINYEKYADDENFKV
jgi:hypothetical protein